MIYLVYNANFARGQVRLSQQRNERESHEMYNFKVIKFGQECSVPAAG